MFSQSVHPRKVNNATAFSAVVTNLQLCAQADDYEYVLFFFFFFF